MSSWEEDAKKFDRFKNDLTETSSNTITTHERWLQKSCFRDSGMCRVCKVDWIIYAWLTESSDNQDNSKRIRKRHWLIDIYNN